MPKCRENRKLRLKRAKAFKEFERVAHLRKLCHEMNKAFAATGKYWVPSYNCTIS